MVHARKVVYTILLGDYEDLLEQPVLHESQIDAICFTDNPALTSNSWNVVKVAPRYLADLIRSQREIKTQVTNYLGEYDQSLYIDNTVRLKVKPEEILNEWLELGDFVVAQHSFRMRLLDEFDEVARLNYDDAIRVHEQLWDYATHHPALLESRPLWTGMIARRHSPEVVETMRTWFEQILRYSRRDQLSIQYSLDLSNCKYFILRHDNFESKWHSWALDGSRNIGLGKRPPLPAGPPIADVLRSRAEALDLRIEVRGLRTENGLLRNELEAKIAFIDTIEILRNNEVRAFNSSLYELKGSTSWKITAPIRRVADSVRSIFSRAD